MANMKRLGQALRVVGDEIQKFDNVELNRLEILEQIYQQVYQQVCIFCNRQEICWQEEKEFTYAAFAEACNNLERYGLQRTSCFPVKLQGRCSKTEALAISLWNQMLRYHCEEKNQFQYFQDKQQIAAQLIAIGEQLAQEEKKKRFFIEKNHYQLLVGYAGIPKNDNVYSGDSWGVQEIGEGKMMQILSDGMGSGQEAHLQSETTVRLLKNLVYGGLSIDIALQIVNLVLSSRFAGESFSTVDLAIWDMYKQEVKFLKYGASPSFVKREKNVFVFGGPSLPIGILPELEGYMKCLKIEKGDMLIMMSDGLYDLNEPNVFQWEKIIASIPTPNPQLAAEYLLAIATSHSGRIAKDDLTVIVSCLAET